MNRESDLRSRKDSFDACELSNARDSQPHKKRTDYRGEKLAIRLERFGGYVLRICDELPNSRSGKHVEGQLRRSGTAPGAHYSEALGAQSHKDFVHKLSLALKEVREARYWLGAARYAGFLRDTDICLAALQDEATEFVAILQASQHTARNGRS